MSNQVSRAFWAIVLLCVVGAGRTRAESYYLLVFSTQGPFNAPRYSHSFATFVRIERERKETITISWFPATLRIRTFRFRPESGTLLDLPSTLSWAEVKGARVSMWGPFKIQKELFQRARLRAALLESGTISYKAIDRLWRPQTTDCVHAVSGVDVDPGLLRTRTAHGDIASYILVCHFAPWIIHPEVTHDWVIDRLCLDRGCISRRDFCSRPRSPLPILRPYYDQSSRQAAPAAGVEAPQPPAPQAPTRNSRRP